MVSPYLWHEVSTAMLRGARSRAVDIPFRDTVKDLKLASWELSIQRGKLGFA